MKKFISDLVPKFVRMSQSTNGILSSLGHGMLCICTIWLEIDSRNAYCSDGVIVIPLVMSIMFALSWLLVFWSCHTTRPIELWAGTIILSLVYTNLTTWGVTQLRERMQWLGPVRPPVDEHRN